jgi:hypothetical protein
MKDSKILNLLLHVFCVPIPSDSFCHCCYWVIKSKLIRSEEETLVQDFLVVFTSHISFYHCPSAADCARKRHERLNGLGTAQLSAKLLNSFKC